MLSRSKVNHLVLMTAVLLLYAFLVLFVLFPLFRFGDLSHNFKILFSSRRVLILWRTFMYSAVVALITTTIGFMIAWISYVQKRWTYPFFITLLLFISVPAYIHNLGWMELFSVLFNQPIMTGFWISVLVQSLFFLPISIGIHYIGLYKTNPTYIHINALNTSKLKGILYAVLNLNRRYFVIAALLIFILCLNDYSIPSVFAFTTYPIEIMTLYASGQSMEQATFAALPMILLSASFMILLVKKISYKESGAGLPMTVHNPKVKPNPGLLLFFFFIFILVVMVPLIFMMTGLDQFNQIIDAVYIGRRDFLFSFTTVIVANLIMVLFSILINYVSLLSKTFRSFMEWMLILQLSIPGTIAGLGIIGFYQNFGSFFDFSSVPTIHVYLIRYLPIAYFIVKTGFTNFTSEEFAVIRLESKKHLDLLGKLILPNIYPHLMVSLLFGSVLSLNELCGSILTVPPGQSTITITIYNYLHYGSGHVVIGLALTTMFINLFLMALALIWLPALSSLIQTNEDR